MRKILFLIALFSIVVPTFAQVKVVDYTKMMVFLPQIKLSGFERQEPIGSTDVMEGMTNSYVYVDYVAVSNSKDSVDSDPVRLRIDIADVTRQPYAELQFDPILKLVEYTDINGYEKKYKVKNVYPGRIRVQTVDAGCCQIEFAVDLRFKVGVAGTNTQDIELLKKLIESMDLVGLSKLEPDK